VGPAEDCESNVLTILAALLPVFGLIALGFGCGRTGFLDDGAERVLSRFVAQLTLPALVFKVIAESSPAALANPPLVVAAVGAPAIVWSVFLLFERARGESLTDANIAAFGASFGNHAFVGLPVCLALIGPAAVTPAAVIIALTSLFVFGWGLFVTVLGSSGPHSPSDGFRVVVRQLGTNPLVIACVAGVLVAVGEVGLSGPLAVLLTTLGGATGPCALIAIGLFVAQAPKARPNPQVGRATVGKLMLMPLVTVALLAQLPPLPPPWLATAILLAGMPTGTASFVLASQAGPRSAALGAAMVVISTLAAAVTLPLLVAVSGQLGLLSLAAR
jgi:malonate transporter and related proteins